MKRFLFFITTALLITAAGFTDRGYGKIKWEPISRQGLLTYNYGEDWVLLEDELPESAERIIVGNVTEKLGSSTVEYIIYRTAKSNVNTYYSPESVIYLTEASNSQKLHEYLKEKKELGCLIAYLSEETHADNSNAIKEDELLKTIVILSTNAENEINRVLRSNKMNESESEGNVKILLYVYEYNDDTYMLILENVVEDKIIVIYTYHEPDY